MSGDELRAAFAANPAFDSRDRHFAARLVMGTLENIILLDHMLDRLTRTPVRKCRPLLRELLRMGACQILFMDSVTDAAAVDESVRLAVKLGFAPQKNFVNAVLRGLCRDRALPDGPENLLCSVPDYLFGLLKKQYKEDGAIKIMRAFGEETPLCVRFLRSRAAIMKDQTEDTVKNESPHASAPDPRKEDGAEKYILGSLQDSGVTAVRAPFAEGAWYLENADRVDRLPAFSEGLIQVQSVGSILAGQVLSPAPGSRVLDLCSAPGGKTIDMADSMGGIGEIIACDISPRRLEKVRENAARCGFSCIRTEVWDAAAFRKEWEGTMDCVMADLPCSGLGTVAHRPEIRYRVNPAFLRSTVELQRQILANAWRYLKPGGRMVFSTCTINRTENEENYRWLLHNFPVKSLPIALENADGSRGFIQLVPGIHPCGGFFISLCMRDGM